MSKINGSIILLYANGTEIAAQKDLSLNVDRKLFPTTTKQSMGWDEHGNGEKSSNVPFNLLVSTTGLSAKELYDFINIQKSLVLVIIGFIVPYVMEVDLQNMVINAPTGEATGLSGTFIPVGRIYKLTGSDQIIADPTVAQMITDPDAGGSHGTVTTLGLAITSFVNTFADLGYVMSNTISVTNAGVYKLFVFMTLNSGVAPTVGIWDNTSAFISNTQVLVAGLNVVTLISTANDASASLRFSQTGITDWATSNIYLFNV